MGYTMAVVNQKGGVGKTTTVVNLATLLAKRGKKTLMIDLDPQGNASSGLGLAAAKNEQTIYDVLINDLPLREVMRESGRKNLTVCPANIHLAGAEAELRDVVSRETVLKRGIEPIKDQFDVIIVDCPPALGFLTINALTAADGILIPIQSEYYALEGLTQLMETVSVIRRSTNQTLQILGVAITMFDSRTQLAHQVAQEVRKYFGSNVFRSVIPRNVRLSEAPSHGKAIIEYDAKSKGAESYDALAREVIQRLGGQKK